MPRLHLTNPAWFVVWLACVAAPACSLLGADDPPVNATMVSRWAVIVVGLPGDEEHAAPFREVARAWRTWLVESLDFEPRNVLVFEGNGGPDTRPSTRDSIQESLTKLGGELQVHDALWVFMLGHANYDGSRAFFHVAGPDPDAAAIGKWLSGVQCREQVIWLTNSCAGWFVKPLSKAGRIVISATAADFEFNETEFPHALAIVMKKPLTELDGDGDKRVSVLELFTATVKATEQIFEADKRVPTEHAQLDDDGDGRGAELSDLLKTAAESAATASSDVAGKKDARIANTLPKPKPTDGRTAAKTYVPYRPVNESDSSFNRQP